MKDYLTVNVKKEVILSALKRIKLLSGGAENLDEALMLASPFAFSPEDTEAVNFVSKLLQGLADGSIKLDFDIYELYSLA